jgi:hypothetical protein
MTVALTRNRVRIARLVAVGADLLQIGLFPLFGEGFLSPVNDLLDLAVCFILTKLVGWHFAFLPSLLVELVPLADVIPTWTIAVLLATRGRQCATTEAPPAFPGSVIVESHPSTAPGSVEANAGRRLLR